MWSGSGSERTRSITGLNFKGGPSGAPNLADSGTRGRRDSGVKGGGILDFEFRILPRSCGIPHVREILDWGLRRV